MKHVRIGVSGLISAFLVLACSPEASAPSATETIASDIAFVETQRDRHGAYATTVGGSGRADGLYQIGSISKLACTLAVLDLMAEGRVDLNAPLKDYLPTYSIAAGADITVRDLLANRSGLKDGIVEAFMADPSFADTSMPAIEAANIYVGGEVSFEPGTEFDYVISNWTVVQALLEEVDGVPINEILKRRVFGPADLTHIVAFSGPTPGTDPVIPSAPVPGIPDFLTCAGGIAATSEDLLKLVRYPFHSSRLGADETRELMTLTTPEEGYTVGGRVFAFEIEGRENVLMWQSGSNGAFKSRAVYDPGGDIGMAIVTNENSNEVLDERRALWMDKYFPGWE